MSKIMILGAGLPRHPHSPSGRGKRARTALVCESSKLPPELEGNVSVLQADPAEIPISALRDTLARHDVVINSAGTVTQGDAFVNLVDRVVAGLEAIPAGERPVCWFTAGAGLLDIDDVGRRGVDLQKITRSAL